MATQVPSRFTLYVFDNQAEEDTAYLYTVTQKQGIQNRMAMAAEAMLNLKLENGDTSLFFAQQASLEGQITAYSELLALCEDAENRNKQPSPPEN